MSKVSFWSFYNNYCYDENDISMLLQMEGKMQVTKTCCEGKSLASHAVNV